MVESVDTRDLKSSAFALCGFKSRSGYHWEIQNNQSNKQCRETTYGWFLFLYFHFLIPFLPA